MTDEKKKTPKPKKKITRKKFELEPTDFSLKNFFKKKNLKRTEMTPQYFLVGFIAFSMIGIGLLSYATSFILSLLALQKVQVITTIVDFAINIFSMWVSAKLMFRYFTIKEEKFPNLLLMYLGFTILLNVLTLPTEKTVWTWILAIISVIISEVYFAYLIFKTKNQK